MRRAVVVLLLSLVSSLMVMVGSSPAQATTWPVCGPEYTVGIQQDVWVGFPYTKKAALTKARMAYNVCWTKNFGRKFIRVNRARSEYTKYFPYRNDLDFHYYYDAWDTFGHEVNKDVTLDPSFRNNAQINHLYRQPRLYFHKNLKGELTAPRYRLMLKTEVPYSPNPTAEVEKYFYFPK
jgi:hypothetical protein